MIPQGEDLNHSLSSKPANSRARQGITGRTLSGLVWTFLGTGLQSFLQLVVMLVLVRVLGAADFGLAAAATTVTGLSTIFSQLGIGPAVVQRANLERRHLRTAFTVSLILGALLSGLIWLAAPAVASLYRMELLADVLRVSALAFLIQGFAVVPQSLLQRDLEFRRLASINATSYCGGYAVVGILLALSGLGVWALVAAQLTQALLTTTLLVIARPHPRWPQLERGALRDLLYFGGGHTFGRIANYFASTGDNMVVGRWLGADALGFYTRSFQMMMVPVMLFGQVLDTVLFPVMASMQHQPAQLATAYRRGVALIALLTLPVSAAVVILAPELIQLLLGPEWASTIVPFQVLATGLLFRTSYKMGDSLARATGAVYRRAWRQAIYAVLVVGGAWVGQHWGIPGVAFGVAMAILVNFILMAQLSASILSMSWLTFVGIHVPALLLTTAISVELWVLSTALRDWHISPAVLLIVSLACVIATVLTTCRFLPHIFIGREGMWIVQMAASRTIGKLKPLRNLSGGTPITSKTP
ncbi:MAG: lipopolysaccharide biosynthesis protein [Chloroflexota bacterium]|nr:MAG: lipopolysaccharide biosynthesis protein [Chloroflexota bacterium]